MEDKKQPISDANVVTATNQSDHTETPSSNRPLLAFVAGVIVAVGGWYLFTMVETPAEPTTDTEYPAVVATVDGVEVPAARLTQSLEQNLSFAAAQGADVTDETVRTEIEAQALESVINTRLLVAAAREAGYTASDEEIDAQIQNLTNQFGGEEAFAAEVESAGLDTESLRTDVGEQIAVDTYLRTEVITEPLEASDEEVEAFYAELTASGQELPALDEIRSAIATEITQRKEQEAVVAHIDVLREEADIEIHI